MGKKLVQSQKNNRKTKARNVAEARWSSQRKNENETEIESQKESISSAEEIKYDDHMEVELPKVKILTKDACTNTDFSIIQEDIDYFLKVTRKRK